MKYVIPFVLVLVAMLNVKSQELQRNYDKFKDKTFISVKYARLKPTKSHPASVYFSPTASHAGTTLESNGQAFAFWFTSSSSDWQFIRNNRLIVLADGERLDLGNAVHKGDVDSNRYSRYVTVRETMGYQVKREDMEKIAGASHVELQLGSFEGELGTDEIAAIRSVLRSVTKP